MRKALYAVVALVFLTGCSQATDTDRSLPLPAPAAQEGGNARHADSAARQDPAPSSGEKAATEQRAIAYTANLRVRVKQVEPATAKAKELVDAANGYVANERTHSTTPSARLDFQVPSERYTEVLDALSKQLGEKVSLEQTAEDVTEQIADVDSRVASAEAALKRLRTLLGQARTVGEVLQVSEEVDQRQADLDALKARQKSLSQRVKEASITLVVSEEKPAEKEKDASGFLGGLKAGWEDFTGFLSGLLTVVGWLLPFSPFLVALFFLGRLLYRRRSGDRG